MKAKMKMWIELKFVAAEVTRLHCFSALRMGSTAAPAVAIGALADGIPGWSARVFSEFGARARSPFRTFCKIIIN